MRVNLFKSTPNLWVFVIAGFLSGCVTPLSQEARNSQAKGSTVFTSSSTIRSDRLNPVSMEFLIGKEWTSESPISLDGMAMQGLSINKKYDEANAFVFIYQGIRNYPSSFDYFMDKNVLALKVKFSAAGLPIGKTYHINVEANGDGTLTLYYDGEKALYRSDDDKYNSDADLPPKLKADKEAIERLHRAAGLSSKAPYADLPPEQKAVKEAIEKHRRTGEFQPTPSTVPNRKFYTPESKAIETSR